MTFPRWTIALSVGAALLAPHEASAVFINEIAWRGSSVSAADEWIELYNDSEEVVSLEGWYLTTTEESPSPNIALAGTIGPRGFFLIERTDDDSVPNVPADLIRSFGNGLSNDGETLVLKNAAGMEEDRVEAGTAWANLGGADGYNSAQRAESTWFTAVPTPRATNAVSGVPAPGDVENGTTTPEVVIDGSPVRQEAPPFSFRKLYVVAGPSRVVSAGASVPFEAVVYDGLGKVREGARVIWSFGDGAEARGRKAEHSYELPGEYLAVAKAEYGFVSAVAAIVVRVEEVPLSLSLEERGIRITSTANRILDLSRYELVTTERTFVLPSAMALLPGGSVVVPASVSGIATTSAASLQLPGGKVVAVAQPQPVATSSHILKAVTRPVAAQAYAKSVDAAPEQAQAPGSGAAYLPGKQGDARFLSLIQPFLPLSRLRVS